MLGLKSPVGILKIHPTHTNARLRMFDTCIHLHTTFHTQCTSAHTHTHLYTSSHIDIPTQGLKLINRMKLDQTEKRGKKEEDRKKKEQESAEAISGLKRGE